MSMLLSLLLAAAPHVAVLSTSGDTTVLRFQRVGDARLAPVAASFTHLEGSTVLGATVPGRALVLAVAALQRSGDPSFGASVVRLEAGAAPRVLVSGVALPSRPVVSASGRVFVQRGSAGVFAAPGLTRVDSLHIDEVDVETSSVTVLYAVQGSFAYPAGFHGNELIVYELVPEGARLVAVDLDSRAVRVLRASLPPMAHDFLIDPAGPRVVYTLGVPGTDAWTVVETRLDVPASRVLGSGDCVALLPTLWPDGRLGISAGPGKGLVDAQTGAVLLPAQGPGYERVRFFAQGVAIGLHEVPSSPGAPFAVGLPSGVRSAQATGLLAAPGARLDLAGVVP